MYALLINDFSAKSSAAIFDKHIDKSAKIRTDEWKGYRPIAKKSKITQIPSDNGGNFKALHTMIHQIKLWIRKTYSCASHFNVNRYYDEFCYRINRYQTKESIFNNLIVRMGKADKVNQHQIICH